MALPVVAIARCGLCNQGTGFTLRDQGAGTQAERQKINFIAHHISFPHYAPTSFSWRSYKILEVNKKFVLSQTTGDQQDFKAWFVTGRNIKGEVPISWGSFSHLYIRGLVTADFLISKISTAQAARLRWHPIGLKQKKACTTSSNDSYFEEEEHHL